MLKREQPIICLEICSREDVEELPVAEDFFRKRLGPNFKRAARLLSKPYIGLFLFFGKTDLHTINRANHPSVKKQKTLLPSKRESLQSCRDSAQLHN
jgi:hypothetical protein